MITGGKPIASDEARSLGLVDARGQSGRSGARGRSPRRCIRSRASPPERAFASGHGGRRTRLADLKADAARQPHLPALAAIAASLDAAAHRPFAEGEAVEASAFRALLASPASRALRHAFFAERAARRIPDLPEGVRARGSLPGGRPRRRRAARASRSPSPTPISGDAGRRRGSGASARARRDRRGLCRPGFARRAGRGRAGEALRPRHGRDQYLGTGRCGPGDRSGVRGDDARRRRASSAKFAGPAPSSRRAPRRSTPTGSPRRPGGRRTVSASSARLPARACWKWRAARTPLPTRYKPSCSSPSASARPLSSPGAATASSPPGWRRSMRGRTTRSSSKGRRPSRSTASRKARAGSAWRSVRAACSTRRASTSARAPSAIRKPRPSRALFEAGRCGSEERRRLLSLRGADAASFGSANRARDRACRPPRRDRAAESIADREIFERLLYPMINEAAEILAEGVARRPRRHRRRLDGGLRLPGLAGRPGRSWRTRSDFARWSRASTAGARGKTVGGSRPCSPGLAERGERLSDWRRDKA